MSDPSLNLSFTSKEDGRQAGAWVHLEQIVPDDVTEYSSLKDLHALWLAAATGRSAQLIRSLNCPVEFDGAAINIYLGFYAWPSSEDLAYSLSASLGEITTGQKVLQRRQTSIFVNNSAYVDLQFNLMDAEVVWETPVFDPDGNEIDAPAYVVKDGTITFSCVVFGSILVTGLAAGFHHVVKITLSKEVSEEEIGAGEDPYPHIDDAVIIMGVPPVTRFNAPIISSVDSTITASWMDGEESGTEQMGLTIPRCVAALLAMCPDMYQTLILLCQEVSTLNVYFNACNGTVIYSTTDDDAQVFCTQLAAGERAMANPWGIGTLAPAATDPSIPSTVWGE